MLPRSLIYDPELTLDVTLGVSVASGFNSISMLSLISWQRREPSGQYVFRTWHSHDVGSAGAARENPRDIDARSNDMNGAWLCGMTLMSSGTNIHHKIAHVLGGGFGLPHGSTHAIVLPHSTSYNRQMAPDAMAGIGRAFNVSPEDAPQALFDLLGKSGAAEGLRDLGLSEDVLEDATDRIMTDRYFNLRDYDRSAIRALLQDAWEGRPPSGV